MKKGPAFEAAVAGYLSALHPRAERRVMGGVNDRGDIAGVDGWVLSCKACREWRLAEWADDAAKMAERAGVARHAVVIKRTRKGVEQAYAVVPLWLLAELMLPDEAS